MRKQEPFEAVALLHERARRRLPRSVYLAVLGGQESGTTMRDNEHAFGEVGFRPAAASFSSTRDLTTDVMGVPASLPILLSPAGAHALHPDGESAVAKAAHSRGVPMGISAFATQPIEKVTALHDRVLAQMYWIGSRSDIAWRMDRARAAGATGLILTTDWSFGQSRDWGSPRVPRELNWRSIVRFAPEALVRPRWAWDFVRSGQLPDFSVPNLASPSNPRPHLGEAFSAWRETPPPSWDDVRWAVETWDGPFMLKGVMRPDDARRAADAGVTAISVSNHGGNNLDGTSASIRTLASIVDAVGAQVEVLQDGGVRRGSDVAKSLALGARAVLIGRPYLWGLAVGGQAGVEQVIDLLHRGLDSTMFALGHSKLAEFGPEDLVIPPGFQH